MRSFQTLFALRLLALLSLFSLLMLPGCPATDDDDATGDDDDATGDDDDSAGDDDDSAGDDDDSAGDDDDSASADADGDGFPASEDCDDGNINVNPDGIEICGSGVDEDCAPATNCDDLCLIAFDYGTCGGSAPVLPTPVLHWDYEAPGATSLTGVGSSATVGTFTGTPAFGAGFVGDGVTLDGSSWIFAANALALSTASFTFVTWVRVDVANNQVGLPFMMSSGNGIPNYTGAGLYLSGGDTTGGLLENQNSANELLPVGPVVCDGGWAQVAMIFSGGAVTMYVDGQITTDTAAFLEVVWGAQPFGVGNDPNNLTRALTGELDETQAYDAALAGADLGAMSDWDICNR